MTQPAPSGFSFPAIFCAALELGAKQWRIAFTDGERVSQVSLPAGDFVSFEKAAEKARVRFKLPAELPLRTCYEAGRDGFWIHRRLEGMGVSNVVLDSSSIKVDRRAKQAKSDGLDAAALGKILVKYARGDRSECRVVTVPSVEMEDARRPDRERERLTKEKTQHQSRIRALLATQGLVIEKLEELPSALKQLQPQWAHLAGELSREKERLDFVLVQMRALDKSRREFLKQGQLPWAGKALQLETVKGIGLQTANVLTGELFGWRVFKNARQLGACAGLAPTPYSSGGSEREQGISKAGSRRVRRILLEVAWGWLRYQPDSALTKWYQRRFAQNGSRSRNVGIVALARKLLIVLWRFVEQGEVPEGMRLKT